MNRSFSQHTKRHGTRALLTTLVLAGTATFLSACAGATSTEATASAAAEQSASPSPSATKATLPTGSVIKTKFGPYLQTTILDSDPAMKLDPKIVDPAVSAKYSDTVTADALRFVIRFIAEEGIDSPLNGRAQPADEWWTAHKQLIHPDLREDFYNEMVNNDGSLILSGEGYYFYDEGKTRVTERTLTPTRIFLTPDGSSLAVETDVNYTMPLTDKAEGDKTFVHKGVGKMSYSVVKDAATGKWQIDGYQLSVKINRV